MPFGFTMPPASAAEPSSSTVRVALISDTTNDRREFDLSPAASTVNIGRASRNRGKQLEASSDNALFDCPVVSRIHAELRLSPLKTFAQPREVTIADMTSLHGTKVNGTMLQPGQGFTLKTGDKIQLGQHVMRGDGGHPLPDRFGISSANKPLDAHDGVSLTFERMTSGALPIFMSSTADIMPITTRRGFRAPSFSLSDASDVDSEHMGSYISEGEHHTSSAKTTPEQKKMKLGTQSAPIALDGDLDDSDDEEITFSRVPESDVRPALDAMQHTDFDSFSDVASLQEARYNDEDDHFFAQDGLSAVESDNDSDIDQVDDVEDSDDHDDEDNMAHAASSDFSSEEDFDSEEDNEEPTHREPSPELGSFDDAAEASTGQPIGYTDLVANMDQTAWNASSSKQRYDPVRSSVPPVVEQAPEPVLPAGRTTTTSFTYGYPGYDVSLATNFPTSKHWDVQHPVYSSAFQPGSPGYSPMSPSYQPNSPTYQPTNFAAQPLFPMSIDAIVEPVAKTDAEQPVETAVETAIEAIDMTATKPSEKADGPSIFSDNKNKRKRDELEDVVDASQPRATASEAPNAPPARRRRTSPKKHHSAIRKAVVGATQAAAFAAVGAVGTVAFLSSPMAESLIQWLG